MQVQARLRRRLPNGRFVILTPDADLWQSVLLYERTGKIHPVIGPDLSLDGMAAVLGKLDFLVAGDSWMLHLAAAVGTATIGLFESRARQNAPRGDRHRYLEKRPLKKLDVDEVLDLCASESSSTQSNLPLESAPEGRDSSEVEHS